MAIFTGLAPVFRGRLILILIVFQPQASWEWDWTATYRKDMVYPMGWDGSEGGEYHIFSKDMGSWHIPWDLGIFVGYPIKMKSSSHYTSRNTYIIFDTMGYPTEIPYHY